MVIAQAPGVLRHRDEALGGERFLMREKLLSIGDDSARSIIRTE